MVSLMSDLLGTVSGMGTQRTHIVWDWNGTLLHDIDAVISASNAAFAEVGYRATTTQEIAKSVCEVFISVRAFCLFLSVQNSALTPSLTVNLLVIHYIGRVEHTGRVVRAKKQTKASSVSLSRFFGACGVGLARDNACFSYLQL